MELNLTTFLLELVNFLVLVWILKRLFYLPVKAAIEARRLEIQKSLDEAASARTAADGMRQQVEGRLKEWSREREVKLGDLKREVDQERERLLKELHAELANERDRLKAQELATQEETKTKQEQEAISQSLAFLSKLLTNFASSEVERAILRAFLEKMKGNDPPPNEVQGVSPLVVHSDFPLAENEKSEIIDSLGRFQGGTAQVTFGLDSSLVAGFEIIDGSKVMRANLRDELGFFAKAVSHG